jgi:ribonuclease Z
MHVVFLGTGGFHPTDERQTNCILIPEAGIVLDAGTGFYRLITHVRVPRLNILLTHAHLDHICGLVYLSSVIKNAQVKIESVNIYTPPLVKEAIVTLFTEPFYSGTISNLPVPVEFHDVAEGEFDIDGAKVTAKKFLHRKHGAWGYRITKMLRTVTYITDTFITQEAEPLLKDADLAVCESYFHNRDKEDARESDHSYPLVAGKTAKKAGAKKLILTHINPSVEKDRNLIEECSLFFPGAQLASDGRIVEL